MGSWNHTCMVSRMPILAGEDVVSVFLAQKPEQMVDHHCYLNAFYDPLPYLIYGKYNDYGAVEDFDGPQDDLVVEFFRRNIIEMEVGENKSHDIEVKIDAVSMENLYEYDHEGRLFIKCPARFGGKRVVDHVQIKRSLFDKIINESILEAYNGDGYEYRTFASLMHNIDGATRWFKQCWAEDDDEYDDPKAAAVFRALRRMRNSVDELVHSTWRNTDVPPHCAFLRKKDWDGVEDNFVEDFCKADFERARTMLIERMKFSWFEVWMSRNRHYWTVPGGTGQNQETDGHILLANFMLEESARIADHWDEWESPEPEQLDLFAA